MRACLLQSSTIDRVAFDDHRRELTVWFEQGRKYVYFDVPGALFDALCNAPSAGAFFNQQIKDQFVWQADPDRKRYRPKD